MMQLLDLNDDCLENVLKYLDLESIQAISETCKKLSELTESAFKKHTHYNCVIDHEEKKLKAAAIIIRKAGPHLKELHLDFGMANSAPSFSNGDSGQYTFLSLVKNSVGDKLRELSISSLCSIPVLRLCPIYEQLEKLTVSEHYSDTSNVFYIDLPALCPSLQVLIIKKYRMVFAPNPMKSFKNLIELEFESFGRYYPTDTFVSFMAQNKQLKKLYIDAWWHDHYDHECLPDINIDLRDVTDNLKNLEELRIKTVVFDNVLQGIVEMKGLSKLHTLEMAEYWDDMPELNEALHYLTELKHLKHLWIGNCMCGLPDQQSIINIAVALQSLESFQSNLELEAETIIEFIRHGQSLKTICLYPIGNLKLTSRLMKDAAEARELAVGSERQPLTILIQLSRLSDDLVQVFDDPYVKRFLRYDPSPPFQGSKNLF